MGLRESEFWDMTKAEVERYLEGAVWQMKQKAQFDYTLADLIGISVARVMDSNVKLPTVQEAYSILFQNSEEDSSTKETEEELKTRNSVNNFLAFARRHNAEMQKGVENIEDDN